METRSLCPSSLPPLPDAGAVDAPLALPWIVEPVAQGKGGKSKAAPRPVATSAAFSILDRCVLALTIVTAASLAFNGYAKPSHSRELLPKVIVTSSS